MSETLESIASLLGLGPEKALQPPRFAKVTAVSSDTVTVTLGASTAEAVRCCVCAVDDVVLLETLPNGTLAAVGARGQQGGGGGVNSVTVGTVSGATFANSGTAENVVLDLAVPQLYEQGTSGIWTYRKWTDGTAEAWGNYSYTVASWTAWGSLYYSQPFGTAAYPAGLFTAAPVEVATLRTVSADGFQSVRSGTGDKDNTRSYFLTRPTSGASNTPAVLSIYAVGRWQ